MKAYEDLSYEERLEYWSKIDTTKHSKEDMEFWKELKEHYQWQEKDVELLRKQGNFSEADKVEKFTFDEWYEWSENEKEQILSLETALKRHDVAPFSKKKNDTNFSEGSEEQEYTDSNKGWTKEELNEIINELIEDLERRKKKK